MNVAELDRAIDGNRADTPETLNVLYEGMVKQRGIVYFEFPPILEANKVRTQLLKLEEEFAEFKENPQNKVFPQEELDSLKNQWKAALRSVAKKSGQEYRDKGEWAVYQEDLQPYMGQIISSIANATFPEDFLEGIGIPESYNQKYMEYVKKISDLQNSWDLHYKWPVIFSADYIDTWISSFIGGHPTQYWLPRQRFKRLAKGGSAGLWVDKWASEILGKEVRLATKGQFLDIHAQWIKEYMEGNPI